MNRFNEHDDIVIDTQTHLIWTRNAALSDFPMTWNEAFQFINEINETGLHRFNDWKLPNRRELYSLISLDAVNPSLPPDHPFINVFDGYYWTSTTCARLPDQAWYVHLGGARIFKGMKYQSYMVWPVRKNDDEDSTIIRTGQRMCYNENGDIIDCNTTGQDGEFQSGIQTPTPRFIENSHTITDNATHLMWLKDANGLKEPLDWQSAIDDIEKMNTEQTFGYGNWRLPDIRELERLIDLGRHSPALPEDSQFTNVQDFYWSATPSAYDPDYAWALYMKDGIIGVGYKKLPEFYLWPVRSIG